MEELPAIIKVKNERVTSGDTVVELTKGQSKYSDSNIAIKEEKKINDFPDDLINHDSIKSAYKDLNIKQEPEESIEVPDYVSAEDISTLSHDIKTETEECDLSQIKMETEESNSTSTSSEQTKHVTNNTLEDDLCVKQPKEFICASCNKSFISKYRLIKHIKEHKKKTDKKTYACQYCPFNAKHSSTLRRHLLKHTGEKAHACQYCPYKAAHASNLKKHMIIHTGEKTHACQYCPFKAGSASTLKVHIFTHTGEKPHACQYCPYKAKQTSELQNHLLTHTGEKPHSCQYCPYKFALASNLKKHMVTHTGEKTHACQYCPLKFASTRYLKRHLVTHTGEKPHACQYCPFKTASTSHLKIHIFTHTGEKPHACQYCPYKAKQASELRKHMLTHTGEKAHACQYCPYKGAQASNLKKHMLTHTGEKSHACQYCPYKTTNADSLKKHVSTHTGNKPYVCQYCPYKTVQASYLRKHMLLHTEEGTHLEELPAIIKVENERVTSGDTVVELTEGHSKYLDSNIFIKEEQKISDFSDDLSNHVSIKSACEQDIKQELEENIEVPDYVSAEDISTLSHDIKTEINECDLSLIKMETEESSTSTSETKHGILFRLLKNG